MSTVINSEWMIDDYLKFMNSDNVCFIIVKIDAYEKEMANNLMDSFCLKLEKILSFMHGMQDKRYGLGIINYRLDIGKQMICKNPDDSITTFTSRMFETSIIPINFDKDDWFFRKDNGNEQIWTLMKGLSNEIQKRIMKSVEWIGMAINQREDSIAIIECMFAIEALLQNQEGFITKSITAQIGEYVAFIIGDDRDSRLEIWKLFKKLYGLRSKIVHGTNEQVIAKELSEAIWLSKQVVINLLMKSEFSSINTMDDLRKQIEDMRYS